MALITSEIYSIWGFTVPTAELRNLFPFASGYHFDSLGMPEFMNSLWNCRLIFFISNEGNTFSTIFQGGFPVVK